LDATLNPHLCDVLERRELLTSDNLDGQPTTSDFTSQAGDRHAARRKCDPDGFRKPERCVRANL
jgi:hypothetical protein